MQISDKPRYTAIAYSNRGTRPQKAIRSCGHAHRTKKSAGRCADTLPTRDTMKRTVRRWGVARISFVPA